MRLLHPQTLFTIATSQELDFNKSTVSRKQAISHAWSEVLKYLATQQSHPKMFLDTYRLGVYTKLVYLYGVQIGCNFNSEYLEKYENLYIVFNDTTNIKVANSILTDDFDDLYLMSDCVSFHMKGLNLGEIIFGRDRWNRIVPINGLAEIVRVTQKAIDKNKKIVELNL